MKNNNIWAPWRSEYLKSLSDQELAAQQSSDPENQTEPCFLCRYWQQPEKDSENLILWRAKHNIVLMNRFPYTAGHLLIAPLAHVPDMDLLDESTMTEMMHLARDAQKVLAQALRPHGFNLGINIGRCAGAGLPDHIHLHVVPRWDGDTNFMTISAQVRVISQSLQELLQQLHEISQQLKLP